MGCNCGKKGTIPLSVKKEMRKNLKDKIKYVKKLWKESETEETNGNVTVTKDELGFK